jgi:xanthine/CO dehydrogenase XdhC/CoxF family maturation factor
MNARSLSHLSTRVSRSTVALAARENERTLAPEMAAPSEDVLEQAAAWRAEGMKVAIATVVETWGSSPRPPGSRLAVNDRGAFAGSVSGGCIEGAVVTEALAAMTDRRPRLLSFGVTNEMSWEVGLACGGQVRVFVEVVA